MSNLKDLARSPGDCAGADNGLATEATSAAARTAMVTQGVQLLLAELDHATLCEAPLANGMRADVLALSPTGEVLIVEVKSSLPDLLADRKWQRYRDFCDRFYFAVDVDFPRDRLPEQAGQIVADGFGGAIVREEGAGRDRLAPARRKALTLAFARLAAARLLRARKLALAESEETLVVLP